MVEPLLRFADGRPFATGQSPYFDHPVGFPATPRIVVSVRIGEYPTQAVVDTGGVYFICDPAVLVWSGIDPGPPMESARLNIRGVTFTGDLYRLDIVLEAEAGQDLHVDVTTFVPQLMPDEMWTFPMFLGLQGCLERVRFAVDPASNTFYFGALGEMD